MFLCRSRRKRRVSEKEKRKKSYHLASSWAWLRFSVVYPGETGALPANPYDTSRAQQNHEVDHRSNWPQENRKKKRKKDVFLGWKISRKRACFMSILNGIFFVLKKKRLLQVRCHSLFSVLPWDSHRLIATRWYQDTHHTLWSVRLRDDTWSYLMEDVSWDGKKAPISFFSPIINSLISLLDGRLHQLSSAVGHLLILISCSVAPLNKQKGFNFKLQCKQGFCKFLSTCHKQGSHKS